MRAISYEAWRAAADVTEQGLVSLRRRDQIACAWGRNAAYLPLGYFEIDAVAMALVQVLGHLLEKTRAARLVRREFDIWAQVVANAEYSRAPAFFTFVELLDKRGQELSIACGTTTDDPQLIKKMADKMTGAMTRRTHAINMHGVITDVRANAKRAGYLLNDPFLPPPGSNELAELLAPFKTVRDEIARLTRQGVKLGDAKVEEKIRRAGLLSRALAEANLPENMKVS
jgi:hypothetical protein